MHAHTHAHKHKFLKSCLLVLLETQISLETFGVLRKNAAFSWVHSQIQEIVGTDFKHFLKGGRSLNIFLKIMQNDVECDKK